MTAPGRRDVLQGTGSPPVAPAPSSNAPATSSASMLTWSGPVSSRLEAVRVVLGTRGMRATGSIVAAADGAVPAYSTSYTLATDETGVLSRLSVRATTASGERHVTASRSEEGIWLIDAGDGAKRTSFDGALDIDVAGSPLFNALPIRRLGLHCQTGDHELAVVYVDLPSLEVSVSRQRYRTVAIGEPSSVEFSIEGFRAELTVDEQGLVLDYPGVGHRI